MSKALQSAVCDEICEGVRLIGGMAGKIPGSGMLRVNDTVAVKVAIRKAWVQYGGLGWTLPIGKHPLAAHKTWRDFYRVGVLAIKEYPQMADLPLDGITSERIADFAHHRQSLGLQVSSVNSSLRVLRRVLRLATEWGELGTVPKVRMLPGERHRERVLTYEGHIELG